MRKIPGGVLAARGYRAAGVSAGLKTAADALDVGMIVSETQAAAAGCFTRNRVCSAAVRWSRGVTRRGRARAILVNSGNANACAGQRGETDAAECAQRAARLLRVRPTEVLLASTGIIGHPLPMAKMRAGIGSAVRALGSSRPYAEAVARAIMTTDTVPKSAAVSLPVAGQTVRIGGIAKGAGMISPRLGTMLSFITTDAALPPALLRQTLRSVVDRTYNRLTVDGDCSTNDTVLILANGASRAPAVEANGKALHAFTKGLEAVARCLVQQLARDGEGATRLVVVTVHGARTERDADRVARTIANSPLVKCAVHGGDPNWGRIVCAAGYSGPRVDPALMDLKIGGVRVFRRGMPSRSRPDLLAKAMGGSDILIDLDLGQGHAEATMWTCDLSKEYVAINADYHT